MYRPVSHVIFDMDGLLLDSEGVYDKIMSTIANKYDKEYTLEARNKILATDESMVPKVAISEMDLPLTPYQFLKDYVEIGRFSLQNIPLLEGAEKLVRHLHKHKIPIAIETSTTAHALKYKIKNYQNLFSLFHHMVLTTSDPDVKRGKPYPDIYRVCASRFSGNPAPERCLVLEDTFSGVEGARAAGMQVVMVPTKKINDSMKHSATLVLKSLQDFKPELFGLPAFGKSQRKKK